MLEIEYKYCSNLFWVDKMKEEEQKVFNIQDMKIYFDDIFVAESCLALAKAFRTTNMVREDTHKKSVFISGRNTKCILSRFKPPKSL